MKKLTLLLIVLALAMPSMAAVTLTGTSSGLTATIGYSYDGTGARPRAFALTIAASAGNIASVGGFKTNGVSTAASQGYGIFPGTIAIDSTGTVTAYNTPVEPATLPGASGTGTGTSSVIVAMGSLYVADANKPANSGTLLTVTGSASCTLTITPETTYRGGVVGEDAAAITVAPITVVLNGVVAPLAPTPVAATQGAASTTTAITVTWGASAGATSYDVYKSFKNDTATATLIGTGGQTSPFVYSAGATQTAADGRTTYFWVKAKNTLSSPFSASASGWIQECIKSTSTWYTTWTTFGRPNCWAYQRSCRGDADGIGTGIGVNKAWINSADLGILAAAFNQTQTNLLNIVSGVTPGICADNDRLGTGIGANKAWVNSADLTRLSAYFNATQTNTPVCGTLAAETTWYTSNCNFWKN